MREGRRPAACFNVSKGVARGAYGDPLIRKGEPQQVLRRELDFPNHVLRRFGDRDAIPQAGFHRIPEQPLTCFFLAALGDDTAGEHRILAPVNFHAFDEAPVAANVPGGDETRPYAEPAWLYGRIAVVVL